MSITPITYNPDPTIYLGRLMGCRAPVLLDSGSSPGGRYDILAADPLTILGRDGEQTYREDRDGQRRSVSGPIFDLVRDAIADWFPTMAAADSGWPFAGGAIGLMGYEALHGGRHLPRRDLPTLLPDVFVGIYGWAIMQDHQTRRAVLLSTNAIDSDERSAVLARIQEAQPSGAAEPAFSLVAPFVPAITAAEYREAFSKVVDYIHAGDCYQVNLAQRLSAPCTGSSLAAYRRLRQRMRSPFSAFLQTPRGDLLSLSPERLLEVREGIAETRPIKGTVARERDPDSDRKVAEALANSVKDRAENLMIVDLLRNDLAKHAETGSVRVEKLFALESYANVHHLVSVISARLAPGVTAMDMLRGCFPGGSITGAPKLRARQIIDEVEPQLRSAYCGSIFYASACGRLDANINIRSVVRAGDTVHVWGGGGIVADSDCETEYCESLLKITPIIECLQQSTRSE